jgi:hypothetical protein
MGLLYLYLFVLNFSTLYICSSRVRNQVLRTREHSNKHSSRHPDPMFITYRRTEGFFSRQDRSLQSGWRHRPLCSTDVAPLFGAQSCDKRTPVLHVLRTAYFRLVDASDKVTHFNLLLRASPLGAFPLNCSKTNSLHSKHINVTEKASLNHLATDTGAGQKQLTGIHKYKPTI